MYVRYANRIGTAGDTSLHSSGAENPKNSAAGTITNSPVATFTGLCRAFCHLPPRQNTVFPSKYSKTLPTALTLGGSALLLRDVPVPCRLAC